MKHGKLFKDSLSNGIRPLFSLAAQKYIISTTNHIAHEELSKLKIPVLVLGGKSDLQVNYSKAKKLSDSNPRAKLIIIDGMNHVLKDVPPDPIKNFHTYNSPKMPINKVLSQEIGKFVNAIR